MRFVSLYLVVLLAALVPLPVVYASYIPIGFGQSSVVLSSGGWWCFILPFLCNPSPTTVTTTSVPTTSTSVHTTTTTTHTTTTSVYTEPTTVHTSYISYITITTTVPQQQSQPATSWHTSITASPTSLSAGQSTKLTATVDHQLGSYSLGFEYQSGPWSWTVLQTTCKGNTNTCTANYTSYSAGSLNFLAYIANNTWSGDESSTIGVTWKPAYVFTNTTNNTATGGASGSGFGGTTSKPASWGTTLSASPTAPVAGSATKLTATVNHQLGKYTLAFEYQSGPNAWTLLNSMCSGAATSCTANYTSNVGKTINFIAYVSNNTWSGNVSGTVPVTWSVPAVNTTANVTGGTSQPPWNITLTASPTTLNVGNPTMLIATLNRPIGRDHQLRFYAGPEWDITANLCTGTKCVITHASPIAGTMVITAIVSNSSWAGVDSNPVYVTWKTPVTLPNMTSNSTANRTVNYTAQANASSNNISFIAYPLQAKATELSSPFSPSQVATQIGNCGTNPLRCIVLQWSTTGGSSAERCQISVTPDTIGFGTPDPVSCDYSMPVALEPPQGSTPQPYTFTLTFYASPSSQPVTRSLTVYALPTAILPSNAGGINNSGGHDFSAVALNCGGPFNICKTLDQQASNNSDGTLIAGGTLSLSPSGYDSEDRNEYVSDQLKYPSSYLGSVVPYSYNTAYTVYVNTYPAWNTGCTGGNAGAVVWGGTYIEISSGDAFGSAFDHRAWVCSTKQLDLSFIPLPGLKDFASYFVGLGEDALSKLVGNSANASDNGGFTPISLSQSSMAMSQLQTLSTDVQKLNGVNNFEPDKNGQSVGDVGYWHIGYLGWSWSTGALPVGTDYTAEISLLAHEDTQELLNVGSANSVLLAGTTVQIAMAGVATPPISDTGGSASPPQIMTPPPSSGTNTTQSSPTAVNNTNTTAADGGGSSFGPWIVTLVASPTVLATGTATTLTATVNRQIGNHELQFGFSTGKNSWGFLGKSCTGAVTVCTATFTATTEKTMNFTAMIENSSWMGVDSNHVYVMWQTQPLKSNSTWTPTPTSSTSTTTTTTTQSTASTTMQPGPTTITTTIPGSGVQSTYVPITITNGQGTPTPTGLQQMITFNPSQYSSFESSDLGNIRFYYGGTALYSWCESGCSNSSSAAVFWIKLPVQIPGSGGSIQVNMTFMPVGTEYDGVYAGEAPQLSQRYAEFDNGANVFINYWNFEGTSLPSGFTGRTHGNATYTVDDGVTFAGSGFVTDAGIVTTSQYSNLVADVGGISISNGGNINLELTKTDQVPSYNPQNGGYPNAYLVGAGSTNPGSVTLGYIDAVNNAFPTVCSESASVE